MMYGTSYGHIARQYIIGKSQAGSFHHPFHFKDIHPFPELMQVEKAWADFRFLAQDIGSNIKKLAYLGFGLRELSILKIPSHLGPIQIDTALSPRAICVVNTIDPKWETFKLNIKNYKP